MLNQFLSTRKLTLSTTKDEKGKFQKFIASAKGLSNYSYGEIKFEQFGRKSTYSPFVTTSCNAKPSTIWNLLTVRWKLSPPSIVLGIVGEFETHDKSWKSVTKGSWIITTGASPFVNTVDATTIAIVEMDKVKDKEKFYSLSSKARNQQMYFLVGDLIKGTSSFTIGSDCASVSAALQRYSFKNSKEGLFPLLYRPGEPSDLSSTEHSLDRNHSFFIFVEGKTKDVDVFRSNILSYFASIPMELDSTFTRFSTIPLVLNLVSDEPNAFQLLYNFHEKKHMVIVHKSAQHMTKLLKGILFAAGKTSTTNTSSTMPEVEVTVLIQEFANSIYLEIDVEKAKSLIDTTRKNDALIVPFPCPMSSKSFCNFVLEHVASNDRYSLRAVLRLALNWKKTEVIEKLMDSKKDFSDPSNSFLRACLTMALTLESPDFLEILYNYGLDVYSSLSTKTLRSLYHQTLYTTSLQTPSSELIKFLMGEQEAETNSALQQNDILMDISEVIQLLTKREVTDLYLYTKDTDSQLYNCTAFRQGISSHIQSDEDLTPMKYPQRDVFLWCVLTGRDQLAQVVWKHGPNPTAFALVASVIYETIAEYMDDGHHDVNEVEITRKAARDWEERAMNLISSVYKRSVKPSMSLLATKHQDHGGFSCLTLAYEGKKQDFMSSPPCQRTLDFIWCGKTRREQPTYKILIAFIFPFLIPWLGVVNNHLNIISDEKAYNPTFSSELGPRSPNQVSVKFSTPSSTAGDNIWETLAAHPESRRTATKRKLTAAIQSILDFFASPRITYMTHSTFLVMGIFVLSYIVVMMNAMKFTIFSVSIQLILWYMAGNFAEELRQILSVDMDSSTDRIKVWFHNKWNRLDIAVLIFFITGLVIITLQTPIDDKLWLFGKICLSISLLGLYLRTVQNYIASKYFGPMIYMIQRMLKDTTIFLGLMGLILVSYGIVFRSLHYDVQPPGSSATTDLLSPTFAGKLLVIFNKILLDPYWQIYGNALDGQLVAPTNLLGAIRVILAAVYVMFTSILMVNLLVAMYSFTFDKIQERSYIIWSYYRYDVVREYADRPSLPSPLILISHIAEIIEHARGKAKTCNPFTMQFSESEMQFNNDIEDQVFQEIQSGEDEVDEDVAFRSKISNRQNVIEQKLDRILAAIGEE